MTLGPPLITARCKRCHRIAGKYWVKDGEGFWFESRRMFGRACKCDPAPILPDGEKLVELLTAVAEHLTALAELPAGHIPNMSYYTAPLVIRV